MKKLPLTQAELFMRHVYPEPNTGCWLWGGGEKQGGYGVYRMRGSRSSTAQRAAWILFRGEIPPKHDLHHKRHDLCPRWCVNPDHLEPMTRRAHKHEHAPTHCIQGHAFTPENTRITRNGKRACRHCHRDQQQRYRARGTLQ